MPTFPPMLHSLPLHYQGKVRDMYEIDDTRLLMVATDRLSAYDVVLPDAIPGKGEILTQVSRFWFEHLAEVVPSHLTGDAVASVVPDAAEARAVAARALVVRRLQPVPIEAIVRGYLIGSGWREYQRTGSVCGLQLPAGLPQAARLAQPIFTPSTKAAVGDHDVNIDFAQAERLVGPALAAQIREVSLALYSHAAAYAAERGILIADTKFEFGLDAQGRLTLMDELLTPDSSRFWPAADWRTGISPPSFDKQYVRDYLDTLAWDHQPPGPSLPAQVIANTSAKYREVAARLLAA
ncbi:MAG TPA: phosphoribosylaminoimidazolesuccinocarboxamide synthase [Gammaproteobacteria bacterium]|nr:phosphoribosylaminoimidazolesuccinocarboxamide synthase [Gammaproteobacteria bacterium]